MVLPIPLFQLRCGVNSYDWGKKGKASEAAILAAATTDLDIQDDKPYAELWMGTHPSLPSRDLETNRTLQDLVSTNESLLSSSIVSRFGSGKIPFLFKVLSVNKALSIQAHPDKRLAERLHAADSKNYPDDNHKPEMTIAITPFTGFCGFRPLKEIANFFDNVPPLAAIIGDETINEFKAVVSSDDKSKEKSVLKKAFQKLMESAEIETHAKQLVDMAKSSKGFGGGDHAELGDLIVRLNKDFEHDVGLFCTFFLNYVKLEPGEGMFLQANDPHAYLSGGKFDIYINLPSSKTRLTRYTDIIECMAASDNVVRAGFTPKFKDVKTLVDMLTYQSAPPSEQKMKPTVYPFTPIAADTETESLLYDPPIEEFSVVRTTLTRGSVQFKGIPGPSIILFTSGQGKIKGGGGNQKEYKVVKGSVFFVGAGLLIEVEGNDMMFFRALCTVE